TRRGFDGTRMPRYPRGVKDFFPIFRAMPRRITFLVFPQFQILDATGPIAAFEIAERYRPGTYALRMVAMTSGLVASSSGACLQASPFGRADAVDTLIVAGGAGSGAAAVCEKTRRFLLACAQRSRRVASVCSGTYVLAAAGLLEGRRATTHWSVTADFSRRFANVRLDAGRIYVRDGKFWSSGGITAGIDLALALIGEDLGEDIARRTAQQLVVYRRRPGGQSQFSPLLQMERAGGRFGELWDHVRAHLRDRLGVAELARVSCMSPRNFSRVFKEEVGIAPAKAIERLRVDTARADLESGNVSIQQVAAACGFGSPERMRRSFLRVLGAPPSALKRRGRRA
ncbi:MAG TPA: GlxA family transcriptional regulator, partial [Steroidobacteraceae bacterium]|nr:GlxA family transcriptional regulator [Steroidobacteraceae bacterium]